MRHPSETERYNLSTTQQVEPPSMDQSYLDAINPSVLQSGNTHSDVLIGTLPANYRQLVENHEALIQRSQTQPYHTISWVLAGIYCTVFVLIALLMATLRLFKKRPSHQQHQFCKTLAEKFYYVPEMVLHKAIEVDAYLRYIDQDRRQGNGKLYEGKGIDLGCGQGVVGGVIRETLKWPHLEGFDLYAHNAELVVNEGYSGFQAGDLQDMPIADDQYDYAISVCVLEHIPDIVKTVSEAGRILKPGGKLHFTTPAKSFRTSTLGYRFFSFLGAFKQAKAFQAFKDIHAMHYTYLNRSQWHDLLSLVGFRHIEVRPLFSRRQLALYDLLNMPVYWLQFYFSGKIQMFGFHHPWFAKLMSWASAQMALFTIVDVATIHNETHFYITCTR